MLSVAAALRSLLTFRFNRQLRKQKHDHEGKLRTKSDENDWLSAELRNRSEQLGILQVEFLG